MKKLLIKHFPEEEKAIEEYYRLLEVITVCLPRQKYFEDDVC